MSIPTCVSLHNARYKHGECLLPAHYGPTHSGFQPGSLDFWCYVLLYEVPVQGGHRGLTLW